MFVTRACCMCREADQIRSLSAPLAYTDSHTLPVTPRIMVHQEYSFSTI